MMFAQLKSLLSAHVAPGGGYVDVRPFSFCWFSRIEVKANAGDDAIERAELIAELREADRLLEGDDLVAGRDRVRAILRSLVSE